MPDNIPKHEEVATKTDGAADTLEALRREALKSGIKTDVSTRPAKSWNSYRNSTQRKPFPGPQASL
jgi:hypothetical protein